MEIRFGILCFLLAIIFTKLNQEKAAICMLSLSLFAYTISIFRWESRFSRSLMLRAKHIVFVFLIVQVFGILIFSLTYYNVGTMGFHIEGTIEKSVKETDSGSTTSRLDYFDYVYFSVVTSATLGYGDFKPISKVTKIISMLEVLMGPTLLTMAITTGLSRR